MRLIIAFLLLLPSVPYCQEKIFNDQYSLGLELQGSSFGYIHEKVIDGGKIQPNFFNQFCAASIRLTKNQKYFSIGHSFEISNLNWVHLALTDNYYKGFQKIPFHFNFIEIGTFFQLKRKSTLQLGFRQMMSVNILNINYLELIDGHSSNGEHGFSSARLVDKKNPDNTEVISSYYFHPRKIFFISCINFNYSYKLFNSCFIQTGLRFNFSTNEFYKSTTRLFDPNSNQIIEKAASSSNGSGIFYTVGISYNFLSWQKEKKEK